MKKQVKPSKLMSHIEKIFKGQGWLSVNPTSISQNEIKALWAMNAAGMASVKIVGRNINFKII